MENHTITIADARDALNEINFTIASQSANGRNKRLILTGQTYRVLVDGDQKWGSRELIDCIAHYNWHDITK